MEPTPFPVAGERSRRTIRGTPATQRKEGSQSPMLPSALVFMRSKVLNYMAFLKPPHVRKIFLYMYHSLNLHIVLRVDLR